MRYAGSFLCCRFTRFRAFDGLTVAEQKYAAYDQHNRLSACFFSGRKKGGNLTLGYGFKCCPFYIRTGPRGLLNAPKPSRSEAQVLPSSAQSGSRWKVAGKNKETAAALVVEASADAELNPSHVIGDASLTSSSSLTNCYAYTTTYSNLVYYCEASGI